MHSRRLPPHFPSPHLPRLPLLPPSCLVPGFPCAGPSVSPYNPVPRRFRLRIGAAAEETVSRCLLLHLGVSVLPLGPRPPSLPQRKWITKPAAACLKSLLLHSTPSTPPGLGNIPPPRCTPTSGGARVEVMQALGGGIWGQASSSGLHGRFGEGAVLNFALAPPHPHPHTALPRVPHGEIRCFVSQRAASSRSPPPPAYHCYLRVPKG